MDAINSFIGWLFTIRPACCSYFGGILPSVISFVLERKPKRCISTTKDRRRLGSLEKTKKAGLTLMQTTTGQKSPVKGF